MEFTIARALGVRVYYVDDLEQSYVFVKPLSLLFVRAGLDAAVERQVVDQVLCCLQPLAS
jgi:hypothetical protein